MSLRTPDDIGPFWPVQLGNIIFPTARSIDALFRSVPAGVAALGAGVGQTFEETFGTGQQASGKAARDFAQLAQIAALLSSAKGPSVEPARAPAPKIGGEPVIALPRAEDFRNAAASIAGNAASFPAEQKLLRLWTEHGIHPAEVADDALRDRTIAESIRSESDKLPAAYVGNNRTTAATGTQTSATTQDTPSLRGADYKNLTENFLESQENPSGIFPQEAERNADSMTIYDKPILHQMEPGSDIDREGSTPIPTGSRIAPMDVEDGLFPDRSVRESARVTADSKNAGMHDPPWIEERPFSKDYSKRPQTDVEKRLLTDIEGRRLDANFIAGRQISGAPDKALSPANIESAAKRLGVRIEVVEPESLPRGAFGYYLRYNSRGQPVRHIRLSPDLTSSNRRLVTAHEFSHAVDDIAGFLSRSLVPKEIAELRRVYGTLISGSEEFAFLKQPENLGYKPDHVNMKLLAEGIRAYMANPNYFKTIAPKTAARIRAAVNDNPDFKKVIQFNSLVAAGLAGTGARNQEKDGQ